MKVGYMPLKGILLSVITGLFYFIQFTFVKGFSGE